MFLCHRSIQKKVRIFHGSWLEIFDLRCILLWNLIVWVRPDNDRDESLYIFHLTRKPERERVSSIQLENQKENEMTLDPPSRGRQRGRERDDSLYILRPTTKPARGKKETCIANGTELELAGKSRGKVRTHIPLSSSSTRLLYVFD